MIRKFTQTFVVPGTLAASPNFQWKAPSNCTLLHVSACNTSANAGSIKLGTTSDDDAYLEAFTCGVSSNPSEADRDDFVGGQFPRIADGDICKLTVTDHALHMANVCVVLTFAEG